jgi:hypothetical protein
VSGYTTARALRVVVDCRIAGLAESFIAVLGDHIDCTPSDGPRALPLAQAVQALGGSSALLRVALQCGITVATFIAAATPLVNPTNRLTVTGEQALKARLANG